MLCGLLFRSAEQHHLYHLTPSGASGAGKTTFMDVIAGRKNQGRITGDIRVNGHPQAC